MKRIPLTQGKFTIVDNKDYEWLNQWKWSFHSQGYAQRGSSVNGKKTNLKMHRVILNAPKGIVVDHRNGDKLDNRRANIRLCTQAQNLWNAGISKQNKSGYKGVFWEKKTRRFIVRIRNRKDNLYLGSYRNLLEAVIVWNEAAKKYHREFARLNKLPESQ